MKRVTCCCISFVSYIKPQREREIIVISYVVYLLYPTSNHNFRRATLSSNSLYIFCILHQTTTSNAVIQSEYSCISFVSYIKPQRLRKTFNRTFSCISFVSYIKPQLKVLINKYYSVVYLLYPTSNHNVISIIQSFEMLYIFCILHQTTTKTLMIA